MATNEPPTVRVKRLRERRSRGVALVAPVEVGEGGIDLLLRNGLPAYPRIQPLRVFDAGNRRVSANYRGGS